MKRLAVTAPGFSADCVETLEEIKETFLETGGEKFAYIPWLNAADAHIDMLFEIIKGNLVGWL